MLLAQRKEKHGKMIVLYAGWNKNVFADKSRTWTSAVIESW